MDRIELKNIPPDNYVAFGPALKMVAFDRSYRRAKDLAIMAGVSAPLVVLRSSLADNPKGSADGK